MGELLIKPYEISVWEDKLIPIDGSDPVNYKFVENKIAVIGSNTMDGPNKVYDPIFNKKDNGEKTLTFSLKYKYFDPYSENEEVVNPFAALLINERKIKLNYDGQWYEFVIKDHTESSDELTWTYTCTDAFVLELSKNGYNIEFSSDLNNNQGTARELAKKTLEDTDWRLGGVDNFKQFIEEPIYKAVLTSKTGVEIINATGDGKEVPDAGAQVYVFYSYIKNQNGKFVQFISQDESTYTIDDKNVITATNYRITTDLVFRDNGFYLGEAATPILSLGEVETKYHANRLAYGQLTTYDPVMERTVDRYRIGNSGEREVYNYTDYTYTTSSVVTNFITNGDNFNVLEDGTLQGWNPYTDVEGEKVNKLELVTWPELGTNKKLADISTLSQIEGFLKTKFSGPRKTINGKIYNTIYNSGFADNASFIDAVSAGEQFVLRWRAGVGELGQLDNFENLRVVVAKYTQDQPTRFGYYYKHISPSDIIIDFGEASSIQVLNNYVEGGELVTDSEGQSYVIDGVVQTPSTKYIYKSGNEEYVWSGEDGTFTEYNNDASLYLPYNYVVGTAKKAVSTKDLKDPENKKKIGIFLYTTDSTVGEDNPVYIQDIQLTRYIPDGSNPPKPVLIGNIPTATSNPVDHFYLKPTDGMSADEVDIYNDAEELLKAIGAEEETLEPLYNENSEKNLSISVSQSNCFNALQTIAETFECWIDLVVDHDERGAIIEDDEGPRKFVYLKEYAGKDNYAGFKYAINLESIERNINSDEIVTKLIVNQSQSDYVDEGYVSIANAPSNPSGESYILNFDYYYNQGLLDRESTEAAKQEFERTVSKLNSDLKSKNDELIQLQNAFVKSESKRNTFTELVDVAKEQKSEALAEFEELTGGMTYEEYRQLHNNDLIDNTKVPLDKVIYYDTSGIGTESFPPYDMTDEEIALNNEGKLGVSLTSNGSSRDIQTDYTIENNQIIVDVDAYGIFHVALRLYAIVDEETPEQEEKRENQQLTEEDTLLDVIGEIYTTSATINNYGGLLSNIEQEYWDLKYKIDGYKSYILKIWVDRDEQNQRHVFVELNDYLRGVVIKLNDVYYDTTTVNKKYFDILTNETVLKFEVPTDYQIEKDTYNINDSLTEKIKINLASGESKVGIKEEIDDLIEEKTAYVKDFNNKYSRFIQEGTWNSTDYIDSELYYLDALQVSNTSAQPAVSYTINVVEISQLDGYEWYLFDAGDKTYVEDTEFFGWANKNGVQTPAREEVIVSEVEWHLDAPDQNVITVRNYKTRFEDLFQRISAAVQTVQYNEATYAKISSLMDADGTINQDVLLTSLNRISGKQYNLTSDGSVIINGNNILIQNLHDAANRVIINNEGISVSNDSGVTWKKVIDGFGVNADAVTSGSINTHKIVIGSSDNPSFRWDQSGISAYKSDAETGRYDLQTYVRYDEYGLYGIKNGESFKARNLQDILDKAHFAVTWDGFFIKNSYPGGGRVEITSDNDFRVMNIPEGKTEEQEKIKIGALEWGEGITSPDTAGATATPTLYGIRIKNDDGAEVMKTDDEGNITITGTINANAGIFDGLVQVGTGDPYIAIDGEQAEIYSSNYSEGAGYGWMINKDGDAVFNNITARGAIKTAVFEYAEIQAVGGIFIFRPSSTIKSARLSGNDLILKVEKPTLFAKLQNQQYSWCKISNYTTDGTEPNVQSILTTNGLTHVYKISNVDLSTGEVTLENGIQFVNAVIQQDETVADVLAGLEGGALVDMGREDGSSNYGIGVNSSDNTVNLPRRAISLFETVVDRNKNPKISYKYKGILGTLPELSANDVSDTIYNQQMAGTQGIYTDNMYIGDNNQFIAFYTDKSDDSKKLKIQANEVVYEVIDEDTGQSSWHNIADIEAEGVPGPQGPPGEDGRDAILVRIESNIGNNFIFGNREAVLTCYVTKGVEDITSVVDTFTWSKMDKQGTPVQGWSPKKQGVEDGLLKNQIIIDTEDVDMKSIFYCNVSFD